MKIEEAIKILKTHNKWRRGARDSTIKMGDPYTIGIAIDTVVEWVESELKNKSEKNGKRSI